MKIFKPSSPLRVLMFYLKNLESSVKPTESFSVRGFVISIDLSVKPTAFSSTWTYWACVNRVPQVSLLSDLSVFINVHLIWILLGTYSTHCCDCELHFSRPACCLKRLADPRWASWQTAWHNRQLASNDHTPSPFPQVLNGLFGTVEVIQKKN